MSDENKLQVFAGVTADSMKAIEALREGKIPPQAIKKHPGKGGNIFSYVSHIHGTKTMNDAFSQAWDWEVQKWELFDDRSALVSGKLTLNFFGEDGVLFHSRKITEVGPFDDTTGKFTKANIVASAASRCLIRCMLRAFDYGSELYKDEEGGLTNGEAWTLLKRAGSKNGLDEQEIVSLFQSSGFDKEELVDKFEEAWKMVYELAQQRKAEKEEAAAKVRKERAELALANEIVSSKNSIAKQLKAKGRKATDAKEVLGDITDKILSAQSIRDVKELTKQALLKIEELPDPEQPATTD